MSRDVATYTFYGYSPDALTYNAGSGAWTLDAAYDHTQDRVVIEITDDDADFDGDDAANEVGIDANQTAVVTKPDGTPIISGKIYDEEFYGVTKPGGGNIWIEKIEIGGVHIGYLVSEEMTPGVAYSENSRGDVSSGAELSYGSLSSVTCFSAGSLIETANGCRAIEDIRTGDLVWTLDAGFQPVVWTGLRRYSSISLNTHSNARPIEISKNTLGRGSPKGGLKVSPQHRILVQPEMLGYHRNHPEVFIPAKALLSLDGVQQASPKQPVTYHHLLFEKHQIVSANSCLSESLFPGVVALDLLGEHNAAQIRAVLGQALQDYQLARPCLTYREATHLLQTHARQCVA